MTENKKKRRGVPFDVDLHLLGAGKKRGKAVGGRLTAAVSAERRGLGHGGVE